MSSPNYLAGHATADKRTVYEMTYLNAIVQLTVSLKGSSHKVSATPGREFFDIIFCYNCL